MDAATGPHREKVLKDEEVLRLLVIEYSMEDAEHLLSTLRNEGIAVRPSTADNEEELEKVLNGKTPDMVAINTAHQELTVSVVTETVKRTGKDVPVIVLLDEYDVDKVIEALQHGATNVVSSEHAEQLLSVIQSERINLSSRRKLGSIEDSLRESENRCEALLGSSRDAIAYVHEGMHQHANPAYLDMFGYDDFDELIPIPILDMVDAEYAKKLKEILRDLSKGEDPPEFIEVAVRLPDGSFKQARMEFSPASYQGESCTQIVFRDTTIPEDVARLKDMDLVTGVYNRQYMMAELENAIASEDRGDYCLLFIDMDNFRETLNQVGMAGVDMVLSDQAEMIQSKLAEGDIAGRFGDQTFAVACPGRSLKQTASLAETLCKAVESHISEVGDNSITTTCSIGVTPIFEGITNAQDLVSVAGSAAHTASSAGGNRVVVHDPTSQAPGEADDNLGKIEMVKDALANDRLMLAYQPIVSLHGEEGKKYEVLIRLETKEGEELSPGDFMPHIQDHELMVKIDTWVIQRAVEVLKEQAPKEGELMFFLKLSPQTISEPKVLPWMAKLLQKHRVSGQHMVFEMPESKVMTNLKPAKTFLKGLKQLHCQFALEQFGSGLNSFQILKHLPADFLKIDRAFMKDLPKNTESQEKIKELSNQAHSQGKITIAEFVEDAASMSILWQCGVNFVQGNFLQEPEKVMSYDFG
jgi:diguanylate cyclase (GGDEF)-like protein/PAS domain S-box-containing protein